MDSEFRPINRNFVRDQQQALTLKQGFINEKPYRNVKYLIFLVSLLCLGPFYYGFNLTYISTISRNTLSNYFGETAATPAMYGILIGITPIGAGVGALIAPVFMNFLSRKNFLLFFNALAIMISGVIQINRLPVLLSCRFMQGFVIGNYMGVTPIYIKQLTPVPLRGSVGAMSQFFNIGAVVVCYSLGLIFQVSNVNQQFFWRFMFSFTGLTTVVQSIFLIFNVIPESPTSLIENGQLKESRKILAKFNSGSVLDNVFSQYIKLSRRNKFVIRYRKKKHQVNKSKSQNNIIQLTLSDSRAVQPILFNIKDDFDIQKNRKSNILIDPSISKNASITDSYSIQIQSVKSKNKIQIDVNKQLKLAPDQTVKISIKAFIIGFQIPLMQQFSGVKAIVTEIGIIIQQFNASLALYSPLIINIVQLIATACSIFVLSRFGRRPIILFGNFGVAICSFAVAFFFLAIFINGNQRLVWPAMGFIVLFMIIYGMTIGPAVWLYIPEIVPAKVVPPATAMNWLGVSLSVIVTPIVIQQLGTPYPVFLFFGGISTVFFIMNYFMVVETKGLEPSQIAQKLS